MTRPVLPFKVLGQIGPILTWAEGDRASKLPPSWSTEDEPFQKRERSWLLGEVPTYSYDTADEIVKGAREEHGRVRTARIPFPGDRQRRSLAPPPNYDLLQAFRYLNKYLLTWNGTESCVREGRMEELHELAIRMPAGHIVRHGHARAVSEAALSFEEALKLPELVTLLPSNSFGLRSVVRKGLSESHLHLWAVTSAEETWANSLLKPLSVRAIFTPNSEDRRLLQLNLFAGRLLALAVWHSLREPHQEKLTIRPRRLLRLLDSLYFARTPHEAYVTTNRLQAEIVLAVYGSEVDEEEEGDGEEETRKKPRGLIEEPLDSQYRFLLRWVTPTGHRMQALKRGAQLPGGIPESLQDRYRLVQQLHLAAHLRLVQLSAARPGSVKRTDPRRNFLHQALFRYLICRTHHWQLATQQGRTTGLSHFREYYGSRYRRAGLNELEGAELTFDRLRKWRGLRVLEGRVSPPRRPQELVNWILAFARPKNQRIRKFGFVVHFKKEFEDSEERTFSKDIPRPVPRLRWGKRRRMIRDQGICLFHILRRPTPVTPFVVGIDACNVELATPPEVFAPVFRFLRELPIPAGRGSRPFSPYFSLRNEIRQLVEGRRLGMTYHVGEDFRHLLSGLRAICEVVDFLNPQPGDRLGHGTALALRPEDWLQHHGYQAVVPRLEWLDTLVWVHHFLGPGDSLIGELGIEDMIQRESWQVYSDAVAKRYDPLRIDHDAPPGKEQRPYRRGLMDWDWSPLTLWDAWLLRQLDPYSLDLTRLFQGELKVLPPRVAGEENRRWWAVQDRIARGIEKKIGSRNAFLLLALYWLSPEVRKNGDEILVVDMQSQRSLWLELCARVEEKMKRLIREKELVVEVNPSSNRIIGPMDHYGQHHAFQLTLDENRRLSRDVRVSINTDNPAVCNTTLAHEHYLLGEVLIREGVPEAEVVEWLEWLRRNGEEYNFVARLNAPEDDPNLGALVNWLRGIRQTVREARTRPKKHEALWEWLQSTHLRSEGFAEAVIRADPRSAKRLLTLERKAGKAGDAVEVRDLEARIEELTRRLAALDAKCSSSPS